MAAAGFERTVRLWPDPRRGPWYVMLHFATIYGRPECVGMEIRSYRRDDEAGTIFRHLPTEDETRERLTSGLLRDLNLGELIEQHMASVAETLDEYVQPFDPLVDHLTAEEYPGGAEALAEARSVWTDDDVHTEVAAIYLAAYKRGRKPTKAVADHYGISASAAAKRVARAREKGLLPKAAVKGSPRPPAPRKGRSKR